MESYFIFNLFFINYLRSQSVLHATRRNKQIFQNRKVAFRSFKFCAPWVLVHERLFN
jgi:hypothetical protein